MALCVRQHGLLPQLVLTYACAPAPVQAAITDFSEALAKALGPTNLVLLQLVTQPRPGGAGGGGLSQPRPGGAGGGMWPDVLVR